MTIELSWVRFMTSVTLIGTDFCLKKRLED